MHAHRITLGSGWDTPVLDPSLGCDRDQQQASRCHCSCSLVGLLGLRDVGSWLPLSTVEIVALCSVSPHGLDIDNTDGEGKTDDDADANVEQGAWSSLCRREICDKQPFDVASSSHPRQGRQGRQDHG